MTNQRTNKSPLFHSVIAGGSAGISELLIMYPLDVIKTRYQATTSVTSTRLIPALVSAIKQDGFGIYRGILFPILTEAPKRAVKFTANAAFSDIIRKNKIAEGNLAAVISGAATGMSEGLLVVAPELIKIRMQLPENRALYASSVNAARAIIREEGVGALFVGTCATLLRNGAWNTCYFGSISYIRITLGTPRNHGEKVRNDLIAGTISGTLGTIFNTPFDVIKTRIQNASARPSVQPIPMKIFPLCTHIIRTEGVKALWKGFIPKVVRLGPGGGIMLFVYDQVSTWLSKE